MSQNQSKLPSVAELLEMSRTQIVAEAFLKGEEDEAENILRCEHGLFTERKYLIDCFNA